MYLLQILALSSHKPSLSPALPFTAGTQATPKQDVQSIGSDALILADLTQDRMYEIVVLPYNSQGAGPASPPMAVYVGEAVPTGQPRSVEGVAVSATEVRLKWRPPQAQMQNGELLGYKIFYLVTDSPEVQHEQVAIINGAGGGSSAEDDAAVADNRVAGGDAATAHNRWEEEIEVVPATSGAHSLVFLDKFTEYRIQILAFNPAGDGPRSAPITVKTMQGLPGAPVGLRFGDITMQSLRVEWEPPKKRNGEIVGYIVTYETTEENESECGRCLTHMNSVHF